MQGESHPEPIAVTAKRVRPSKLKSQSAELNYVNDIKKLRKVINVPGEIAVSLSEDAVIVLSEILVAIQASFCNTLSLLPSKITIRTNDIQAAIRTLWTETMANTIVSDATTVLMRFLDAQFHRTTKTTKSKLTGLKLASTKFFKASKLIRNHKISTVANVFMCAVLERFMLELMKQCREVVLQQGKRLITSRIIHLARLSDDALRHALKSFIIMNAGVVPHWSDELELQFEMNDDDCSSSSSEEPSHQDLLKSLFYDDMNTYSDDSLLESDVESEEEEEEDAEEFSSDDEQDDSMEEVPQLTTKSKKRNQESLGKGKGDLISMEMLPPKKHKPS